MDVIDERAKNFYHCYEKFDFSSPDCQAICGHKKINKFEFPIKFFGTIGKALKILYEEITENNIEEYYENIKEQDFEEFINDEPIIFYGENIEFKKFDIDNLEWVVDNDEGITLYNDHMAKMYINKKVADGSVKLIIVFILGLIMF